MEAWEPLFERYLSYLKQDEGSRPPGATAVEIDHLQVACQRLGLVLDPSYLALLRIANGTGYDGLFFCGASIPEGDEYGRVDLVYENELIDERDDDTIYGRWRDQFLVRVASTGQFERRSIVTSDAYYTYTTCEALLAEVLREDVGYLDKRYARQAP